mgnify:CR=1 FL=1
MSSHEHKRNPKSPAGQLLRTAGVIFVFILVALFFWKHFERNLDRLGQPSIIHDPDQILTEQQHELIFQFAQSLNSKYGLELEVMIGPDADSPGTTDAKTLSIALNPQDRSVSIHFPVLLKSALPAEMRAFLQSDHFTPYFDSSQPGQGLIHCLTRIWEQLLSLDATEQTEKNNEQT